MFACSVHIVSLQDSQSKFQYYLHHIPATMLVYNGGTPTWRLHTGLCTFAQNILMNI